MIHFNDNKNFSGAFWNTNLHLSRISCESCEFEFFLIFYDQALMGPPNHGGTVRRVLLRPFHGVLGIDPGISYLTHSIQRDGR